MKALNKRPFTTSQKPTVVFVLGGPGSGKGTQCEKIVKDFKYNHISAGELLRDEMKTTSEESKIISSLINKGQVVPSYITLKLLRNRIFDQNSATSRFIIDGFPRNEENNNAWVENMSDIVNLPFVLYLECDDKTMIERLLNRGKTSGRSDDRLDIIQKRLVAHHTITTPVLQYYEKRGKLKRVDGTRHSDIVYQDIYKLFKDVE